MIVTFKSSSSKSPKPANDSLTVSSISISNASSENHEASLKIQSIGKLPIEMDSISKLISSKLMVGSNTILIPV